MVWAGETFLLFSSWGLTILGSVKVYCCGLRMINSVITHGDCEKGNAYEASVEMK